jgi:hypothetical protein
MTIVKAVSEALFKVEALFEVEAAFQPEVASRIEMATIPILDTISKRTTSRTKINHCRNYQLNKISRTITTKTYRIIAVAIRATANFARKIAANSRGLTILRILIILICMISTELTRITMLILIIVMVRERSMPFSMLKRPCCL